MKKWGLYPMEFYSRGYGKKETLREKNCDNLCNLWFYL